MSKVITAAAIMQPYEQSLFKLWGPVSEYQPGSKKTTIAVEKPDCTVKTEKNKCQAANRLRIYKWKVKISAPEARRKCIWIMKKMNSPWMKWNR